MRPREEERKWNWSILKCGTDLITWANLVCRAVGGTAEAGSPKPPKVIIGRLQLDQTVLGCPSARLASATLEDTRCLPLRFAHASGPAAHLQSGVTRAATRRVLRSGTSAVTTGVRGPGTLHVRCCCGGAENRVLWGHRFGAGPPGLRDGLRASLSPGSSPLPTQQGSVVRSVTRPGPALERSEVDDEGQLCDSGTWCRAGQA